MGRSGFLANLKVSEGLVCCGEAVSEVSVG